jgi:simple sugar transport system ATP-binding protein
MRGIRKSFAGVTALDGIDFDLKCGEICALLGENGAGKTTLMKILFGLLRPDAGKIFLRGRETAINSPSVAIKKRIGMVHQHFELAPGLTVAENVVLGLPAKYGFLLEPEKSKKQIERFCLDDGLEINPSSPVFSLSVGEKQRVEILRALYREAEVLILDEPTAVLTPQEAERLFATLLRLRDEGKSIVFISHKLKEVLAISDRIVVLREGRKAGDIPREKATEESLASLMMGKPFIKEQPARSGICEKAILEVRDLVVRDESGRSRLEKVSFTVRQGETVGIAAVSGNGQKELMDKLFGLLPASSGKVFINGKDATCASPAELVGMNTARIPGDRLEVGTIPEFSVRDNLVMERLRESPCSRHGLIDHRACTRAAEEKMSAFQVGASSPEAPLRTLSGGNIQKVVLARELAQSPPLILADQPTRGLDAGAAAFVHGILARAAGEGAGILLVSEDLDELLGLSDRILVLYDGRIIGEVKSSEASIQKLGLMMAGIERKEEEVRDAPPA